MSEPLSVSVGFVPWKAGETGWGVARAGVLPMPTQGTRTPGGRMVALFSPRAMPTLAPVPERQNGPGSELARLVFFSGKFPGSQLPNPECPAG